jgi:hypothetical protein
MDLIPEKNCGRETEDAEFQMPDIQYTPAECNGPDRPIILGELAMLPYAVSSGDGISSHP